MPTHANRVLPPALEAAFFARWEKTANEMLVNTLKTDDPAKLPNFVPNDFNDLRPPLRNAWFRSAKQVVSFRCFWPRRGRNEPPTSCLKGRAASRLKGGSSASTASVLFAVLERSLREARGRIFEAASRRLRTRSWMRPKERKSCAKGRLSR
jgi:hypothetical protein